MGCRYRLITSLIINKKKESQQSLPIRNFHTHTKIIRTSVVRRVTQHKLKWKFSLVQKWKGENWRKKSHPLTRLTLPFILWRVLMYDRLFTIYARGVKALWCLSNILNTSKNTVKKLPYRRHISDLTHRWRHIRETRQGESYERVRKADKQKLNSLSFITTASYLTHDASYVSVSEI